MKTSALNIKIDPKVKQEARKIAEQLGFSLSAIVTASLKNLTRTKAVSYSLVEPTPFLKRTIRCARHDRARKRSVGPFSTTQEMMKSLRA